MKLMRSSFKRALRERNLHDRWKTTFKSGHYGCIWDDGNSTWLNNYVRNDTKLGLFLICPWCRWFNINLKRVREDGKLANLSTTGSRQEQVSVHYWTTPALSAVLSSLEARTREQHLTAQGHIGRTRHARSGVRYEDAPEADVMDTSGNDW